MSLKKISDSKGNSPSGLDLAKFIATLALTANLLLSNLSYAQESFLRDNSMKAKNELVEKNDSIEHQKILNSYCEDILSEYGQEEGIDLIRKHMLIEINNIRVQHGLQGLKENSILGKVAQKHAEYMFYNNTYSHTSMNGKTPQERMRQAGFIGWSAAGENIDKGYTTPGEAIEKWMAEPSHKDIVLYPAMTEAGFGFFGGYVSKDYITTWYNFFVMDVGAQQ